MAEKHITYPQNVTAQGRLVTPLDVPRTFDYDYDTLIGTTTSGTLYPAVSGKWAYVHQLLVCEHSGGTGGKFRLINPALGYGNNGAATPWIPVEPNSCVSWQPCGCPLGPFVYSGAITGGQIHYETDGTLWGGVTVIVQIDPKMIE